MKKYTSLYERLVANTEVDENGCWVWTGARRRSYGCLCLRVPGGGRKTKPKNYSAHRLMMEEVLDATFPFDEVGHLCYNTLCVNPEHLEVQTRAFNLSDRRGYKATSGCMIPVLFPRYEEPVWDETASMSLPGDPCPF